MVDEVANISANEESFDIAQELLDFNSADQGKCMAKWIEKLAQIVHALTNRCRRLADELDAKIAEHAEEMSNLKRASEEMLNDMKDQINAHLASINNLNAENRTKTAECKRFTAILKGIKGQINELIGSVDNEDEQSEGDAVPSEHGNEAVRECDDDTERDAEQQSGQSNDDPAPVEPTQEQGDGDGGFDESQDDDVSMTAGDNLDDAQVDKENVVPPQNAAAMPSKSSSTAAQLQPAPVVSPLTDNSNVQRTMKCFLCIETFVQESTFNDHLARFHGLKLVKTDGEDEPFEPKEPGRFVRNPVKKRKSKPETDEFEFDENTNNRNAERKAKLKKTLSVPSN